MTDAQVQWTTEGHVATITLNRPEKLNALTLDMLAALETYTGEIDADPDIRVVILTGAGERAFCVGADIHAWGALEPLEMWRQWIRSGHRAFDALAGLRQPTIAALNGYTLGGGLELALATDLRIAADHIELGQPEVMLGTIPGWGGTQRLAQAVGSARAKQMIFSGARIDAPTAEAWALVNECLPAQQLMARVNELAQSIASNAPLAVQFAKQVIDGGSGVATGAVLEAQAAALAAMTEDGREGVAAFREKRPPVFRGK